MTDQTQEVGKRRARPRGGLRSRAYMTEFEVSGRGPFPIDMLRYDGCHPARPDDVLTMHDTFDHGDTLSERVVRLRHVGVTKGWIPDTGRWQSFGWPVNPHFHYTHGELK